jgi:RNA polymerase sigma factor (sigma-70 family)
VTGLAAGLAQAGGTAPTARANPAAGRARIPGMMSRLARPPSAGDSPAPEPDDTALIALVADRDEDALAALYHRHGSACYRLARQVTASTALAEDAVQEAFTGLWKAPGSYLGSRGSVRSWLLGLTHHKAVDLVRRETAEQRRQGAHAAQQAVRPPPDGDPATAAWAGMQAAEVRSALLELPEAQRRALTLAYFGGYTQSQIAELTGVPLGTVKTRTLAAMRRLRLRLAPLASQPGQEAP